MLHKLQTYFNPLFRRLIVLRQIEPDIYDFGMIRVPGNGLPHFADTVFIKCPDIQHGRMGKTTQINCNNHDDTTIFIVTLIT